jgi:DNA-binding NarL/FixJ family response regulator
MLMTGMSNRQISESLSLTEHTVENYVSQILDVFECTSRSELIASSRGIEEVSE